MRDGGEVYAEFTVNRIVRSLDVADALTEQQRSAIRDVLIADNQAHRHALDLRLFIPLFYRNFYVCLFAGRDRRKSTLSALALRWVRTQRNVNRILVVLFLCVSSVCLAGGAVWGLYSLKTWLGIDLIPNWHFSKFVADLFA